MKRPRAPRLVTVAIFTTVTVLFWIFFSVYNVLTTTPDPELSPKLLEPINPTLDINTLGTLRQRIYFEQGQVSGPNIESSLITPIPNEPSTEEGGAAEEQATPAAELEE